MSTGTAACVADASHRERDVPITFINKIGRLIELDRGCGRRKQPYRDKIGIIQIGGRKRRAVTSRIKAFHIGVVFARYVKVTQMIKCVTPRQWHIRESRWGTSGIKSLNETAENQPIGVVVDKELAASIKR